jgi:hypothetical protein
VPQQPVTLKVLLGQRHWRDYGTFCAEYSKAAARCDPGRASYPPSRAQLHRWVTGALAGLPQAAHCRVLEEMLPGWTAEQLFSPATPELLYGGPQPAPRVAGPPVFAAPSVGIRPFVEQAFAAEHVTIDFAGFSSETLHGVIQEPLDKIRIGRLHPASLTVRILLPDTTRPMTLPCRADTLADDPGFRQRATAITARHARAITDSVSELAALGVLPAASAEVRAHPCTPMFKLYVLNGEDVFFGFYPITRQTLALPGGDTDMFDLMGKDAVVFHHSAHSGQPTDIPWIAQARDWFTTMWDTISYPHPTTA